MSSSTTSTVLSAMLQLLVAFLAIAAFMQVRNSYLGQSFRDRALEICTELKFLSLMERRGEIILSPFPEEIAGMPYRIIFGAGNVTIHGRGNYTCAIPWLYGSSGISGRGRFYISWKDGTAFAGGRK